MSHSIRSACLVASIALLSLVGFFFVAPQNTAADPSCTDTWTGSAEDGLWQSSANWSGGQVPSAVDIVCVGSGTTVHVTSGVNKAGFLKDEGSLVVSGGLLEIAAGSEASHVDSLTLKDATLTNLATLKVSASLSLGAYATMSGSGQTILGSGAVGSVEAASGCEPVSLDETSIVNEGTLTFAWGTILMSDGSKLENKGTFKDNSQATCDAPQIQVAPENGGAAPSLVSTGVVEKTAGESSSTVAVAFENEGTTEAQHGQLAFSGGGSSGAAGEWTASSGASVAFQAGAFSLTNGSWSGTVDIGGASVTAEAVEGSSAHLVASAGLLDIPAGSMTVAGLSLSRATLAGSGTLHVAGALSLGADARMSGSGQTVLDSGASGTVGGSSGCEPVTLDGRTLVNEGLLTLGWGTILMAAGAELQNKGTFRANSEASCRGPQIGVATVSGEGEPVVVNTGTFEKAAGAGASKIGVGFENEGVVSSHIGKLGFVDGASSGSAGEWIATTGASVAFEGGSFSLDEGSWSGSVEVRGATVTAKAVQGSTAEISISSEATLDIPEGSMTVLRLTMSNATLAGAGVLGVSGVMSLESSTVMSGSGQTVMMPGSSGTIVTAGCAPVALNGRTLVNEGSLTFAWGTIDMANGAAIDNSGLFADNSEASCEGPQIKVAYESEGGAPSIENTGYFEKTEGEGTGVVAVEFDNGGTVEAQKGELVFSGGGVAEDTATGIWRHAGGASIVLSEGVFVVGELVDMTAVEVTGAVVERTGTLPPPVGAMNALGLAAGTVSLSGVGQDAGAGFSAASIELTPARRHEWATVCAALTPGLTGEFSCLLNTASGGYPDGLYEARAELSDGESPPDTRPTDPISIRIDNSPSTGSVTPPTTLGGSNSTVSGIADDGGSGVAGWQLQIAPEGSSEWEDACPRQTAAISGDTYECVVETGSRSNGAYSFRAEIEDVAGNDYTTAEATTKIENTAPSNTTAPRIVGIFQVEQTISAQDGAWDGALPITYTYQWQHCNSLGASCSNISGATGSSYVPDSGDLGSTLRVTVTASNSSGSASHNSAPSAIVTVATLYLSQFGSGGTEPGQMSNPWGLAIDPSGNIWVADTGNSRIDEFSSEGAFLREIGSEGEAAGDFKGPEGITADTSGHIWVTDTGNDRVEEFSPEGAFIRAFGHSGEGGGELACPEGLNVDAKHDVLVADKCNNRVDVFTEDGEYLRSIGSEGRGDGQLSEPGDVATDSSGDVWVADTGNERIEEFSEGGSYLQEFGIEGSGEGQLKGPYRLTIGPESNVWVSDTENSRVELFTATGEYLYQFGGEGSGSGEFDGTSGVGIDGTAVYVLDRGNSRVERFGLPIAPVNPVAPQISGAAVAGQTLEAGSGTWSGAPTPSFTYQWQLCNGGGEECSDIEGATEEFLTLSEADVGATVRVTVSAHNLAGSATADSAVSSVIATPASPTNTSLPAIAGEATQGARLSAGSGTWSGRPSSMSFTYQWRDCDEAGGACSDIEHATEAHYVLGSEDVGRTLRVVVTATNAAGSEAVASSATGVVTSAPPPPMNTSVPVISGVPGYGLTLTASTGEWEGSAPLNYEYQWESCNASGAECVEILDAINEAYEADEEDIGKTLRVRVTATNPDGSGDAASTTTGVVSREGLANTTLPSITGTAQEGQKLSVDVGGWSGSPVIVYSYKWKRCDPKAFECVAIEGATGADYVAGSDDLGARLRVLVTASNGVSDASAISTSSETVEPGPPQAVAAPSIGGTPEPGQTLTADTGQWSGTAPLEYSYQWMRCGGGAVTGEGGNGAGAKNAESVAVDSGGDIWVSFGQSESIEEFNKSGHYVRSVLPEGFGGEGLDSRPGMIAADKDGHVWVSYPESGSINEFDEAGQYLGRISVGVSGEGALAEPYGLAIDRAKHIWVTFPASDRVAELDESGEVLREVGADGSGHGEFVEPTGIAVDGADNVWVVDSGNDRVQELDERGGYIAQFGSEGTSAGDLSNPHGIVSDQSGNLWVVDTGNTRVQEFGPEGEYLAGFGVEGTGVGQFRKPLGIARDAAGELWVADSRNNAVDQFDEAGTFVRHLSWGECAVIEGATSPEYTATEGDLYYRLRVTVTATSAWGTGESSSGSGAEIEPGPPTETEGPTIAGAARDGQTLTVRPGNWTAVGQVQYSYQWESCDPEGAGCASIEGATNDDYNVGEGDIGTTLRATVTVSDAVGVASASTTASSLVEAESASESQAPTVTGIPDAQQVLRADPGAWQGRGVEIAYQWESCDAEGDECAPIEGATESEYDLGEGDVGTTLRVRIGAHGEAASLTDVSQPSPEIGSASALASVSPPSITGTPRVGSALSVATGSWTQTAGVSYAYQWQSCDAHGSGCSDISGATEASYTPISGDVGTRLRVIVKASSGAESASRTTQATQPVASASSPVVEEAPAISGTPLVAHTVAVAVGFWSREGPITYAYEWKRCGEGGECVTIEGASESSYTLTEADAGLTLIALVTATDTGGSATAVSAPTAAIEGEAIANFSTPTISGVVQSGGTLEANPGIWSGDGLLTNGYQWESCNAEGAECAQIEGATESGYVPDGGDIGSSLRVVVTVTGPLGSANATSAHTRVTPNGEVSVPGAIESAQEADPSVLASSTTETLEAKSVAPALSDGEEALSSTGALTSSSISKEVPGEFAVNTQEGEISLVPQESAPTAVTTPTIVNGSAALFANTWPATDTVVRPEPLGATTLLQIRSAEAPKTFSWEVGLGADQELQQLSDGGVAVIDKTEASSESSEEEAEIKAELETESGGEEEGSEPATEEESGETERRASEEEQEDEEEVPLEELPSAPTSSTEASEPVEGKPQPQDTLAQYESATTELESAEEQTGGTTLMVIEPPVAKDASGSGVTASYSVSGDTITLNLKPGGETKYPVVVDPAVVAPSDKVSKAKPQKYRYGLSDQTPGDFTHAGPSGEETNSFDNRLRNGPRHMGIARLVMRYDVLTNKRLAQEEEKAHLEGKRELADQERLTDWLQAVQKEKLEPYITLETNCFHEAHKPTCVAPTAKQYEQAIKPLVASLSKSVHVWGSWNEPDLKHGGKVNPLSNHPQLAAQFWEVTRSVVSRYCTGCKVVAGEFSEYRARYLDKYRDALLCNPHTQAKCPKRYVKWPIRPHIWGMHDYKDVIYSAKHHGAQPQADEFGEFVNAKRMGKPSAWFSEQGVELNDGNKPGYLDEKKASTAIHNIRQRLAALEFLRLHVISRTELVDYYMYSAPTETQTKLQKNQLFDSALLDENYDAREAYCVLAYTARKCAPSLKTSPDVEAVGGYTSGGDACTVSNVTISWGGTINPNGNSTKYEIEYGTTTAYGDHSPLRSLHGGQHTVSVVIPTEIKTTAQGEGLNCATIHFRIVAKNAGGTRHGNDSQLSFTTDVS